MTDDILPYGRNPKLPDPLACSAAPGNLMAQVIGSMGVGFALFDGSDQLQAFNYRYADLCAKMGSTATLGKHWETMAREMTEARRAPECSGPGSAWASHLGRRGRLSLFHRLPGEGMYHFSEHLIADNAFVFLGLRLDDAGETTESQPTRKETICLTGNSQPKLSERQREVLSLLARGMRMKEVARSLGISPRTVAFHKYHAMQANGLQSNAEFIAFALQQGLLAGSG